MINPQAKELRDYHQSIAKHDLLTKEQEQNLAIQIEQGNESAFNQLVERNMRLAACIAKKYANRGMDVMDLIQEANVGLMRAARMFDHTKGYRFSSYATPVIKRYIDRALEQHGFIRIPCHHATALRRARMLNAQTGKLVEAKDIKDTSDAVSRHLQSALDAMSPPLSLDFDLSDTESHLYSNMPLMDYVESSAESAEDIVGRKLQAEWVTGKLEILDEQSRHIITRHYGLDGEPPQTIPAIADYLGMSTRWAQETIVRARRKLKKALGGGNMP